MAERHYDHIVPLGQAYLVFRELTGESFARNTILDWATKRDDHKHPGGRKSNSTGQRVYLKTFTKLGNRYTTMDWIKSFIAILS